MTSVDDEPAGETTTSAARRIPGHLGVPEPTGDGELDRLVTALRRVQDRVIGTEAPDATLASVSHLLEQVAQELEPYRLTGDDPPSWDDLRRMAGSRTLAPVLDDLEVADDRLTARVTFSPFYTGGNGAVHGGVLPLLFDEVLGRLANVGRPMCRTANLSVDYRRVTPIGRPLRVEARFEREEGRKRYLYAAVLDGGHVTAEVHGLFVELRPGQP